MQMNWTNVLISIFFHSFKYFSLNFSGSGWQWPQMILVVEKIALAAQSPTTWALALTFKGLDGRLQNCTILLLGKKDNLNWVNKTLHLVADPLPLVL